MCQMAHAFEKCPDCGAPLTPASDGRSVACGYCGAAGAQAVDPVRLAASLQAESRSTEQLYESLARTLAQEFPDWTRVETSGGFFSSERVDAFELALDGMLFRMRRGKGGVIAERAELVRGIALKTEPVSVESWLQALAEALSAKAGSSQRTLEALQRITVAPGSDR
jgi:uncharacterized Zn finger protein (UPF0148 family)